MTLLDRVMGINSKAAIGTRAPTAAITVNFLSPARLGEIIIASCRVRRVGRGTVFADGEVRVGEKLVATACATFVRPFAS
jgi:acyl-coenzyme A thioesterase PaaI-like protein